MKIIQYKNFYFSFSFVVALVFFFITFFVYKGFKPSITFNGGIRITVIFPENIEKEKLEEKIKKTGFPKFTLRLVDIKENKYDIEFGPDVREELKKRAKENQSITDVLDEILIPNLEISSDKIVSREVISASYGFKMFENSIFILFWTIILITIYISLRFDFSFALGATVALLHDLIITIGFIGVAQIEPSIPLVAAVLTLLGYSINDTIIIFDRIRVKIKDRNDLVNQKILDSAIIETFSRTLITSFLTMLSLIAILVSNAESLVDFSLVLIFGIVIGTYSSIAIASPIVYIYENFRHRRASFN